MFTRQAHIPSPEQLRDELPLTKELTAIKKERDRLTMDVIAGRTEKLLLIIGPCSAHESAPVLEYVRRLGKLNERVKDKLVLVPRIYTNKPRTKGVGYKGMFSQPDPENKEDIVRGIRTIRELHIRAIEESGLSAADEMLYPENYPFLEDLLTYIAVGARSSENQMAPPGFERHRSSRRHQEPHGRQHPRHAQLHLCGAEPAGLQIRQLSGGDGRQRVRSRRSSGHGRFLRQRHPKLPL